jgi:PmbA protein
MMNNIIKYSLNELQKAGAEKAVCSYTTSEMHELNVASGEISLFRTNFDTSLHFVGIVNDKKGIISINKADEESIKDAAIQVMDMANSSNPDTANDISEKQPHKSFSYGPSKPDLDKMYFRLTEFLDYVKMNYPKTIIEEINFSFNKHLSYYANSNDVYFESTAGYYEFVVMFTTKDGDKTSSFNYAAHISIDLDKPFSECSSVDRLIQQSSEQLVMHSFAGKFEGDVIFTPECLNTIVGNALSYIRDYNMIKGSSVYKNKLNKQIASEKLTIHSNPLSEDLASRYSITNDGYEAQNMTIIENGELKSYLLSLYGAKKTGLHRAMNSGGCYMIDAGNTSFEEMIKSTKRGILLCRFSGGNPSDNGDFSGVAKNSYFIEDGEIQYPINETMITGNLVEMLMNIKQISKERVNPGYQIYPWIKFGGVTISGK